VKDLKAGQGYDLEIRLNNAEFILRGSPFTCWGGIRLGGIRKIEEDQGITEAVELAKESDGALASNFRTRVIDTLLLMT
jgi:hypothetical protein